MGARLETTSLDPAPVSEASPVETLTGSPGEKEVLIIEGDPAFEEVLSAFLSECGYSVTSVRTGAAGARMALERDFAVIVCNMKLPGLSGEMLYRAFVRVKPHLSGNFIFLTDVQKNRNSEKFIASVGGRFLKKPFPMAELLELMEGIQAPIIADAAPAADAEPVTEAPELAELPVEDAVTSDGILTKKSCFRPKISPRGSSEAPKPPVPSSAAARVRKTRPNPEEVPYQRSRAKRIAIAAGICLCLVAGFHLWTKSLREEIATSVAKITELKGEAASLASFLPAAEKKRLEIVEYLKLPERITADRNTQGWTPLLQIIFEKAGRQTDIREIRAHGLPTDSRACELQIEGLSTGFSPRKIADQFREGLFTGMKAEFSAPVSVRIDRLEDSPQVSTEVEASPSATFAMTASVGLEAP